MREFTVADGVAERRLDVFVGVQLELSRTQGQRLVREGAVTVNGQSERASYQVEAGDVVRVELLEKIVEALPPPSVEIVYEDDDLVVINKPAGIAVHGGAGIRRESTIADYARTISSDPDPERPGIVHRLDRDTSGLLVIAKSVAAKDAMQEQWRGRAVKKRYLLLAGGRVTPHEAIIRLPLDRDPAHPLRRHVSQSGKPAITRYNVLMDVPGYSYIEARPETGRTHQLRVHFAALGHAIAGDIVYGPVIRPLGLTRQFLHASGLSFRAPSGALVELTSELPADLKPILERLQEEL